MRISYLSQISRTFKLIELIACKITKWAQKKVGVFPNWLGKTPTWYFID